MKETIHPNIERGKQVIAVATLSALALTGAAGCAGSTETKTWSLNTVCSSDGQIPEIRDVQTRGSFGWFQIACGDEAPLSVELVGSPEAPAAQDSLYNIEVIVNDESGGIFGQNEGSLNAIVSDYEVGAATVSFQHVDNIVGVRIVGEDK